MAAFAALLLSLGVGQCVSAASAAAAISGSAHGIPYDGRPGISTLCAPTASYACARGGYAGQSTGWSGQWYGAGYASTNSYGYHNCTLYAAWRLQQNGYTAGHNWGDANTWATNAQNLDHVTVDQNAAIGAIAQWNNDHVAYVEDVTSSYIDVSSDNYQDNTIDPNGIKGGWTDSYRIPMGSAYYPDNFIHAADQTPGASGDSWPGYEIAFQANTGNLWTTGSLDTGDHQLGMMPGTSPSIARVNGGYEVAFQANTGELYAVGALGSGNLRLGMAPGTSPAIATTNGGAGYQIVFQANTGNLWIAGSLGTGDQKLGMAPGTSPAIAATNGGSGWEAAFQANTGDLWVAGSLGTGDQKLGMATATSPAIAATNGGSGWEAAFQESTGNLWTAGSLDTVDHQLGMMAGTGPAIAATNGGSGYQVAFQANTGDLYTGGSIDNVNHQLGMMAGTSPCIVTSLGGSCGTSDGTAPSAAASALPAVSLGNVAFGYSGTDSGSGVGTLDVRYRRAAYNGGFGGYTYPASWQGTGSPRVTLTPARGFTYCFSVRARDHAGNVSGWSGERCTAAPLDERSLIASSGWSQGSGSGYYASTVSLSRAAGRTLTRTGVQAKRLWLVATTCAGCGSVQVIWGGKIIKTVSLTSTSTHYRAVIGVATLSGSGSSTVMLKTTSTARAYLDGLGVSRV